IQTAPQRLTPAGAPIASAMIDVGVLNAGWKLSITALSDTSATAAYVMIDAPSVAIPGLVQVSGTSERLYDGFFTLPRATAADTFEAAELDLSFLPAGVHLVTVRTAIAGTPSFFSEQRAFFFLD